MLRLLSNVSSPAPVVRLYARDPWQFGNRPAVQSERLCFYMQCSIVDRFSDEPGIGCCSASPCNRVCGDDASRCTATAAFGLNMVLSLLVGAELITATSLDSQLHLRSP
jgi:hypothetical protein